jgi:hypothetical protein
MAESENCTAAASIAMDKHEVALRHFRAIDEIVDGVNVAAAGSATPEMERVCELGHSNACCLHAGRFCQSSSTAGPDLGEVYDTRSHDGYPLAARSVGPVTLDLNKTEQEL